MATIAGKELLLKDENKEIRIELDLAQLCWITESIDESFWVVLSESEADLGGCGEFVVHIKLEQRGPPWCHHLQMQQGGQLN
jgi:hypothetical protein